MLDNEGLSSQISFFSDGGTEAVIFGQSYTVTKVWLSGTPDGDVFTWQAAMWIGDCVITNVPMGADALARLTG